MHPREFPSHRHRKLLDSVTLTKLRESENQDLCLPEFRKATVVVCGILLGSQKYR